MRVALEEMVAGMSAGSKVARMVADGKAEAWRVVQWAVMQVAKAVWEAPQVDGCHGSSLCSRSCAPPQCCT